ncbi:MAG: aspartate aminotransferase family protein [Thiotrichaceae bacterium]|nr:aspartate aminotransferase family protein [Thiotrichaceae bacterium]
MEEISLDASQAATASVGSFILNDHNLAQYRQVLQQGLELVRVNIATTEKPFSGVLPHELAERFQGVDLDLSCASLEDALAEVQRLYLDDAVYFHHPKYVAHLNCPIVIPAILAELILSSVNSSVDTWDQSAGGTFIEQSLIDWTAKKIGFDQRSDGIFTSGGTQSNLMAMLLAREHVCERLWGHCIKEKGLPPEYHKLRIFTSELSHFSIQKSAAILGLGYDSVVPVAADSYYRMDTDALVSALQQCCDDGLIPMAIVATAGTTDFGSIDPLPKIADLCDQYGAWMHVDAAYGCGLLASSRYRHWLDGIEQADSVTVDYHKSFFQPVSCGAFFSRDKRHLGAVTYHADYLNPLSQLKEGTPNLVNKSLQTTRRFDALKLWLTLRIMGVNAIGEGFDRVIQLARQTYTLMLSEADIELIHQPQLSTLVFRYRPQTDIDEALIDEANIAIRKDLARTGEAVVAGTKVKGRQYLKFTLLNPTTTIHDIQAVIKLINQHGESYFNDASVRVA